MAKILIPTPLRKFTESAAEIETNGQTVSESIRQLTEKYPDLGGQLLDDQGQIRRFVRLYVGEDDIAALQGSDTPVEAGTVISIIPAIAGGR